MADETLDVDSAAPPNLPSRQDVVMKPTEPSEDESAAERAFATKARRIRLTEDEHADLSQLLNTTLEGIQREREELELDANWDLWENLYFGVLEDRPAGQSNIHVPLSQEVVDTALATVEEVMFGSQPYLQVMPREAMDLDQAKRKEQFLDYAMTVEMQTKDKVKPSLWEAAALGTGVTYLPWLREVERIRDEETYDGQSVEDLNRFSERYPRATSDHPDTVRKLRAGQVVHLTVEYNEARQDAPEPTHIPLRDWIVRPSAKWHQLHRERFVGHRFHLRFAQIEEQIEDSYYDDKLSRLGMVYDEDGEVRDDPTYRDKEYEIVTGILRWKRRGDDRERKYLVDYHRDSRTVLRIMHYPYWHNRPNYLPWYFERSSRSIYGIGLIQKVEHPQFEANATHSLTLDAVAFGAIPMFKARKGMEAVFNPMRDGMFAGKTWYFDNPEADAQRFDSGVNAGVNVLLQLEAMASRHAELASGSSNNLSGLESSRDPDAPGNKTQQLIAQARIRIGRYLDTLGTTLSELGFQTCELYYQFSPKGRVFRVMGAEGMPVFPQMPRNEMRLRADFLPHGSTAALNPEQEKKDTLEMVGMLLKAPELQESPVRRWTLIEMALDVAGSKWSQQKHKILPSAQELELFQQGERKRLEQMAMALTAPAAPPGVPNGMPPGAPMAAPGAPAGMPPQLEALLAARMGNGHV